MRTTVEAVGRRSRPLAARARLALYPAPQLFGVVTWGCAASRWLAHVLDAHPAVFCVHELNSDIAALLDAERLDGRDYLELLGLQGSGYAAAGDVHGITRAGARAARDSLGDQVSFAVLVREPEARLQSQLSLFEAARDYPVWAVDYVDAIIRENGIELPDASYRSRFVVHAANMLNAITEEVSVGPVYRMEDVTTSPAKLGELLTHLTHGAVEPTIEWCAGAIELAQVNAHGAKAGARGLQEWERQVVRRVVTPQAWGHYADIGYRTPDWLT